MKKSKGITLIALVITIIVMLVLVGVTLNITLEDNGIIQKSKEARTRTEEESIYEQIITAGIYGINGIDLDATRRNILGNYMNRANCSEILNNQFTVTVTRRIWTIHLYNNTKRNCKRSDTYTTK